VNGKEKSHKPPGTRQSREESGMNRDDYGLCVEGCKLCGGLGYIRYGGMDVGSENFGKMRECPNRRLRFWDMNLGISKAEARKLDWNIYKQTPAIGLMREAYDFVLERGHGWLYIHGKPGNGKTIMAKSAAIYSRQVLGYQTKYSKISDTVNWLRSSYDEDGGQRLYVDRLKKLRKVKALFLDEVGRDRQTDFSIQSISDIMDSRYEDAISEKTITVWVSNYKPSEIFEAYQVDRITDKRFEVIHIKDASYRLVANEVGEGKEWWRNC